MDMLDIDKYLNVITSEHRMRPKYIALVEKTLQLLIDTTACLAKFDTAFNLDFIEGDQLTILGNIIGVDRNVDFLLEDGTTYLKDEDYKILIKARIAQNKWDGTYENLMQVWESMFPNISLFFIDNFNMSCTVLIDAADVTPNQQAMFFAGLLIPRPSGVKYSYMYIDGHIFAWDLDNKFYKGWDLGKWID